MFGIGPTELIVILVIALIVVGPERLPQLAGQVGKAIRDFRQMSGDVTGEFQRAFQLDEPPADQARPTLTDQAFGSVGAQNGAAEETPSLAAQVIPSDPPIEAATTAEAEPIAAESHTTPEGDPAAVAPVSTDYSTLATPPLATKDEPFAGASMLDEPEPAPATTTYESQAVADLSPRPMTVAEATGMTTAIGDAWDAVMTTDATISLPEPTAADLQPALAATAVALAEPEQKVEDEALREERERKPRVDPAADMTIREVIEAQVAAEAFRERRRIATYRRHK